MKSIEKKVNLEKMILNIFLILTLSALVSSEKQRFDNYTLYKVFTQNDQQVKLLQELRKSSPSYDFWTDPLPTSDYVSVMSDPVHRKSLESFLNFYGITFEVTLQNVQEAIENQKVNSYSRSNVRSMQWDAYYPLEDIEAWMDDLVVSYPDNVTPLVGGISYEGREIKGVKISHGEGKKIIFIEAGIHSREWITVPTACYIINELLMGNDEKAVAAAKDFDWYIFPVTNPDGYVWTHTENRMWRKNRRPVGTQFGVDLNRNWNSNWLVAGSSVNAELDNYAGSGPFSEPETRSLSRYLRTIGDDIEIYLSFHSFSQLLLIPFGNTTEPLANYYDAVNIGRRAMGALSVRYGTQYVTGNIAEAIYEATGGSVDWVKEHLQVPLVYCYELRDQGTYGFLLPPEEILPNNMETMDSILEMIHQAKRFGYLNDGTTLMTSCLLVIFSLILVL